MDLVLNIWMVQEKQECPEQGDGRGLTAAHEEVKADSEEYDERIERDGPLVGLFRQENETPGQPEEDDRGERAHRAGRGGGSHHQSAAAPRGGGRAA